MISARSRKFRYWLVALVVFVVVCVGYWPHVIYLAQRALVGDQLELSTFKVKLKDRWFLAIKSENPIWRYVYTPKSPNTFYLFSIAGIRPGLADRLSIRLLSSEELAQQLSRRHCGSLHNTWGDVVEICTDTPQARLFVLPDYGVGIVGRDPQVLDAIEPIAKPPSS
jgi:hypothetical protein